MNKIHNSLANFIWNFVFPYRLIALLFVFLIIIAGFWGPLNSILIKHIINILSAEQFGDTSLLYKPTALLVLNFIVFDNITWRSIGYINYKIQPLIKNQIISETLKSVMDHSHQFFQDNLSGRIASQINTLADNIEIMLHVISLDFIRGASLLVVSFITAYFVNPMFFYTLFLWFIVFSSFSIVMSKQLVHLADIHASKESIVSGQLVDCLANNVSVKIFSKKNHEISRINKFLLESKMAFSKKSFFMLMLSSIQGLMISIMMGFVAYILIYLYGKHLISIGDFALILFMSMQLGHMMWHTMSRIDEFNQAVGKCKQSLAAISGKQEINDKVGACDLFVQRGQIIFEGVRFQYKDTEPLFQNKSITIEAGQKIGLVGYSGGGKSTFINLILRLYDVDNGRILIDGQDISDVTQDSLHSNIAMIPQDPSLFHRTLKENIRYGKCNASNEDVICAAKKAFAHEFIIKLPKQYESLVGERGIKLSGGQRQRIAIARAILKNAPIFILDEATSQLDSVTEHYIQKSLWGYMRGRTTIVIAHRLSTLLHMDRILVFDQGSIVEDGSHIQLLNKDGLYKKLWDAQVGGFLPDNKNMYP